MGKKPQAWFQTQDRVNQLNPDWTGLCLTCLGWGGRMPTPIMLVVCGPIATKFCTGIDNQSISSNMEKMYIKLMTSQIMTSL